MIEKKVGKGGMLSAWKCYPNYEDHCKAGKAARHFRVFVYCVFICTHQKQLINRHDPPPAFGNAWMLPLVSR